MEKDNLNFNLVSRTPSAVPGDGLGDARSVGHFLEENCNLPKLANLERIPSQFHYKTYKTRSAVPKPHIDGHFLVIL